MILDKTCELATTVAFDLDAVRPGPGKPIKMAALGVDADMVVTTGAADTLGTSLLTVTCGAGLTTFDLPSDTLQFIGATFVAGRVFVILDGQTNI